jgi:Ca-activated chloride channel family protein
VKKKILLFIVLAASSRAGLFAQKENALIRKGNKFYKQKQFDQSQQQYQKAIEEAPENPTANYNLGNSQFRKNNFDDAAKSYQNSIDHADDNTVKENGFYNQGVALIKDKKLEESINSWKDALKLDPNDQDARENLQKAMQELKNKQQQEQKKDPDKKQDKKDQKDQQQQQPKQQQSRLTKKQVEQLLKALQQKENEAQEKMNQNKVKSLTQPDKDW